MDTSLQQQDVHKKLRNITHMGNHLQLDFVKLSNAANFETLDKFFKATFEQLGSKVEGQTERKSGDVAISYLLNNGSLSVHSFNTGESLTVDLHLTDESHDAIKRAEELICENFGWKNCTNDAVLKRGQVSSYLTNDFLDKTEILRNVELLHRERSKFQELRIYDTLAMGRILVLDGAVQICTHSLKNDHYTIDLTRLAIPSKETEHAHVVIIGGGDLLVAAHILEEYPNVKKLTVCEIDDRVVELTRQFFSFAEVINRAKESGRLEIVINGGAPYMEELLSQGKTGSVGAVVIDCTDFALDENSIAAELFTPKFYKTIFTLLNDRGGFSQQITKPFYKAAFSERAALGGFSKIDVFDCVTPEYGGELPLAFCFK